MNVKTKIEQYLTRALHEVEVEIPTEFVEFWTANYDQEVKVELADINGRKWEVDRILHLEGRDEITDLTCSWRGGGPERLAFSVEYLESVMSNWEDHPEIFPFAGINSKDTAQYDLVTLDYTVSKNPRISIWMHEESFGLERAALVMVSPSVSQFIDYWKTLVPEPKEV